MSQLENSAAPAPEDDYDEGHEQPLALSPWAVIACVLGILALFVALPIKNGGFFVGLIAVVAAAAARHDIKRGLKSGSGWAKTGTWLGAVAMAGSIAVNIVNNYS